VSFKLVCKVLLLLTFSAPPLCRAETIIRYQDNSKVVKSYSPYYIGLLKLVIEHTVEEFGDVTFVPLSVSMSTDRKFVSLTTGMTDIMWTTTTEDREEQALAIKIPLLKGLLGKRVFVIRTEDQSKFSTIQSLAELAKYVAIQGTGWPDVTKMRSAGLRVETMEWHPNMHKLVSDGIVDYYPRSVLEVIDELHSINNPHLIIEQNLLLSYDLLNYFFVAKDNLSLAKRIKIGLQKSMEDGSFDTYFKQYPGHSDALDLLNNRRIFDLEKGRTATNN
jgi:hypothetical protein